MNVERQYTNGTDFFDILQLQDNQEQLVYHYDPSASWDKDNLKSIVMKRVSGSGLGSETTPERDRYINITKLFKEKLGIVVKLSADKDDKVVAISMEEKQ